MNGDQIQTWIKTGRSQRLDWLADSAPVESIAQMLTALANGAGGRLLIGVAGPAGTIVGVRDSALTIDRVIQASMAIHPQLVLPLPQIVAIKEKPVVIVQVPEGLPGVYAFDGRFLKRGESDNIPLTLTDMRRLSFERGAMQFETEPADDAALSDIDWGKARAYAALIKSNEGDAEKVLLRRGCLTRVNGTLRPTHAGILLFGNEPQAFVRSADITAVRFAGEIMSDRFTRADIGGTLPDQIRRAETFLLDHLRKDVALGKSMARREYLEYPFEAARELVVNAVAHRDYSIAGDGIRLYLFANRLEVSSPGMLPGPVTIENIREARFSRNPVIVQVLSDMGFIERLGYGVDRVIMLMEETHLPAPEFSEHVGGFHVKLHRGATMPDAPLLPPDEVVDKHYRGVPLNPRQEAALLYLTREGHPRITNSSLQLLFPDVHAETIRRDLSDLVTKDILEKRGEKRGSYYVLKSL